MSFAGNPRADGNPPSDPPQEPTGAVTSDSLAAESYKAGGGFAENENPELLSVKGSNSTLNTTDTSGADVLHPASSGAAREKEDAKGLGSDEKGVTGEKYPSAEGQGEFTGTHSDQGYRGGASETGTAVDTSSSTSYSGATTGTGPDPKITSSGESNISNTSTGARPYVDAAPTYADDTTGRVRNEGDLQPKGKNLKEDQDIPPNRSTFTGDVGGPNDPGRLAEAQFSQSNSDASAAMPKSFSGGADDGNQYDALNSSERA